MKLISSLFPSLMAVASLGLLPMRAIGATIESTFTVTQNSDRAALQTDLFGNNPAINITHFDLGSIPAGYGRFQQDDFLGLGQGVVMSTGKVNNLAGVNCADGMNQLNPPDSSCDGRLQIGTDLNSNFTNAAPAPGIDPDPLDQILLSVRFNATQSGQLNFRYVFASEEYPEFDPRLPFGNDYFKFGIVNQRDSNWVGGSNVASALFNANLVGQPHSRKTPLDGYTDPIPAQIPFQSGDNTLYFLLADAGNEGYDSAVFLQQFSVQSSPVESIPTPSLLFGFTWMGWRRWRDRHKRL